MRSKPTGGRGGPHSNTLWTAFDKTEGRLGDREWNVVGHYRLAEAFQVKLADFFKRGYLFDRDGDALSNKDLPVLGFRAKAGGEIAYGANRGVPGAVSKADLAERCISLRDAGAEPQRAAAPAPGANQCSGRLARI